MTCTLQQSVLYFTKSLFCLCKRTWGILQMLASFQGESWRPIWSTFKGVKLDIPTSLISLKNAPSPSKNLLFLCVQVEQPNKNNKALEIWEPAGVKHWLVWVGKEVVQRENNLVVSIWRSLTNPCLFFLKTVLFGGSCPNSVLLLLLLLLWRDSTVVVWETQSLMKHRKRLCVCSLYSASSRSQLLDSLTQTNAGSCLCCNV